MKLRWSAAIVMIQISLSSIAIAGNVEIHRLNPKHRQEIDAGLLQKVENEINTDLSSKQGEANSLIGKSNEANNFADSMKEINPDDYTNKGMDARDAEHNSVIKSILEHPNIEQISENDSVFAVFDEVTKDPTKFVSKKCQQVIGETGGPSWKELKVKKKIINTEYEKNLCENLQNQYSCRQTLQLRCSNPRGEAASTLKVTNITGSQPLIPSSYNNGYWDVGWQQNGSFYSSYGHIFSYDLNFFIEDVSTIFKFVLEHVGVDDLVLIRLNNNHVFSAPYGGYKLEPVNSGGEYLMVDLGHNIVSIEQWQWRAFTPHINLVPFLKNGSNTLSIKVGVGGWGGVLARFKYESKACAASDWVKRWEETCTHIPVP